ncbi:MAG: PAS domain S-box protein [Bacteroidota bacterium]|nr:PAS domain S-box protein [Bacteroidota bacterium]
MSNIKIITKDQLLKENNLLKAKISELEKAKTLGKESEKALNKSEEKFRNLFHYSPLGYQSLDSTGCFIEVNNAWLEMLGYTREEVIGKNFIEFIPKESYNYFKEVFETFIANGQSQNKEVEMLKKNGNHLSVLFNGKIVYDKNGDFKQTYCVFQDISDSKNAKQSLLRNLEYQQLISEISSSFVGDFDLDSSINNLLNKIGEFCNASRSYVFRFKDDRKTMVNTHEWCAKGVEPQIDNLQNQSVDIYPGWMAKFNKNEAVHINDVSKLTKAVAAEKEMLEAQGIKSLIVLPINISGKLVGFIVFDKVDEKITKVEEFNNVLKISSEILANTIHSVETEKALKESERKYKFLSEKSKDIIILHNLKGEVKYVNNAALEFIGLKHFEVLGNSIYKFLPKNEFAAVNERRKMRSSGEDRVFQFEINIKNKQGKNISFDFISTTTTDNQKETRVLLVGRDVSERKNAEKRLQESEETFIHIFNNAIDSIYVLDKNGIFLEVNQGAVNMYGYSKDELIGKTPEMVSAPGKNDFEMVGECIKKAFRGEPQQFEFWGQRKNGEIFPKIVRLSNGKYFDSEVVYGYALDISKQKNAELALTESEENYRMLFELNPTAFTEEDWSETKELLDDKIDKGIIISKKYFDENPEFFMKCISTIKLLNINKAVLDLHKFAGKDEFIQNIHKIYNDKTLETLKTGLLALASNKNYFTEETEYLDSNGKIISAIVKVRVIESYGRVISSVINITERKKAEQALKTSEEKYKAIFENKGTATGIFGEDKVIKTCNAKFVELSGFSKQEVEGKMKWIDFIAKEDQERLLGYHSQRSKKTGNPPTQYECGIIKKNGEQIFCSLNIGLNGDNRIASLIDISDRKQAEETLRESEDKFRSIFETALDGILYVDKKSKILDANPAFSKITGITKNEIIGKTGLFLAKKFISIKQLPNVLKMIKLKLRNKFIKPFEIEFNNKTLEIYASEISKSGKLIAVIRNITNKKKSEQALKESEYRFKALSEATYEAIIFVEKGIIIEANEAASKISGYCYEEGIGMDITKFAAHESKELMMKNMIAGYEKPYDAIAVRKDGSKFHIQIQGKSIDYKGKKVRMVAIRDITKRKESEIKLKSTKEELQKFNTKLTEIVKTEVAKSREKERMMLMQSKQAAMGEMIGNIAHQWRQPLNDIGLYIQNLQDKYEYDELTAAKMNEAVEKTMDKLKYMSQTIDDFRNFFRSDKEKSTFSLSDSIKKTLDLTAANFRTNDIKIVLNLQKDIYYSSYPNEFSQAVLNILNNAKAVLIERKIKNPQVKICLSEQAKSIILSVSDNAGGIGEDIIDKIFEPYFTTRDKLTGTGLGLYISKTIIEKNMGGSLSVKNIKGGVEFKIEL